MLVQRSPQTLHRVAHAGHQFRRVKLIQAGLKKRLCRGGFIKASLHEQARDQEAKL